MKAAFLVFVAFAAPVLLALDPKNAYDQTRFMLPESNGVHLKQHHHNGDLEIESPLRGPLDAPKLTCLECKLILQTLKTATAVSPENAMDVAASLCGTLKVADSDVCHGAISLYGPSVTKILPLVEPFGYSGALGCATVVRSCPYPDPPTKGAEIELPPPPAELPEPRRPANASTKPLTIVHLSDWHFDPRYVEGSEVHCTKPLCCRGFNSTDSDDASFPAPSWGAYTCDAPQKLALNMLDNVKEMLGSNPDFAIFTGDIPPHDIWETTESGTNLVESSTFHAFREHLGVRVYPAIGNHETSPSDLFQPVAISDPPDNQWLFDNLTELSWKGYLTEAELKYARTHRGSYRTKPAEGLKIISLNTNDCYAQNYWLFADTSELDPNGQLAWLARELADSEATGEKAWIISHIPPGVPDCLRSWSEAHNKIVQRFHKTIAGIFSGHTHRDEFKLFYSNDNLKTPDNAVVVNWIGPSVTPFTQLNPGWRAYTVDPVTFEVLESKTYITDLSLATELDRTGEKPTWFEEYSARDYLDEDWPVDAPLNATFWARVIEAFESDDALFQMYFQHRGKLGPSAKVGCDPACKAGIINGLRAGNSAHVDLSMLRGDEVWAKDLCGMHSHH